MTISTIVQSYGANTITVQLAKLHAKIHFSKMNLSDESAQTAFISSVNKTNKIGGTIGIIVSIAGVGAVVTAFFLTGSMLSLYAGLPAIPLILALSLNALLNRLKAPIMEDASKLPKTSVEMPKKARHELETNQNIETKTSEPENHSSKVLNLTPKKVIPIDPQRKEQFDRLISALDTKPVNLYLNWDSSWNKIFLEFPNDQTISLSLNNFTPEELMTLCKVLCKDHVYTTIDLSVNKFNSEHVEAIVHLIKNKFIKSLNLSVNNFNTEDLRKIVNACDKLTLIPNAKIKITI